MWLPGPGTKDKKGLRSWVKVYIDLLLFVSQSFEIFNNQNVESNYDDLALLFSSNIIFKFRLSYIVSTWYVCVTLEHLNYCLTS